MKKHNLALLAALALGASAANAGSMIAANTSFATENFGSTFAATTPVVPGAVTYSMGSSTTVNPGAKVYFVVRLSGAKFAAAPAITSINVAGAPVAAAATATVPGAVVTLSSDKTTIQVEVTAQSGGSLSLGLGAFSYTPAATDIVDVKGLGVAGATITAAATVTTSSTTAANLDSTNALPASVDGAQPTATVATSAAAIAGAVSALPAYTNKISVTVTPAGSDYTTPNQIALGSVAFTTTAGRKNLGGSVDYTLESGSGAAAATATITVTPGTGQSFPVGSVLSYDVASSACAAPAGALPAITAATASTAKTLTVSAADVTTATPIFVCLSKPSTGNTATPITATLAGATVPAAATDAATSVSGAGYAVQYNGSSVTVNNYVPKAVTGWTQFIRVANTGSVEAAVTATFIDETTGNAGASGVVTTLKPGAVKTLTSTDIETALASSPADTARPRVRITAPTNELTVQDMLFTPNGSFTNNTSQLK